MKTNGTLLISKKSIIAFALFFITFVATAQPDYQFSSPSLESGTALTVGAVYRFPKVKANVDALVSVDAITGGLTLTDIDRTADGFLEAFQPQYTIPGSTSGYIDFTITFVTTNTNTALNQTQVDATGLDIDGQTNKSGQKLYEFNRIDMGGGLVDFDMSGGQITVANTGTAYTATNITGVLYGASVDTNAIAVMFTVMRGNINSFKYRIGAQNLGTSSTRYASLYFKRFFYNNSFLSVPVLKEFKAVSKSSSVELSWNLIADHGVNTVVVEKGLSNTSFQAIGQVDMSKSVSTQARFTDNNFSNTSYYRLKMVLSNGNILYSNVLVVRGKNADENSFKVFPSVISNTATVSVNAGKKQQAALQIVDLNGRVVSSQHVTLQEGNNNLSFNKPTNVTSGMYVAVIKVDEALQTQKIMMR